MEPVSTIYHPLRLDVSTRTGLLARPDEETFDRIARLATRLPGVARGAVTIVHPEGQAFIGATSSNGDPGSTRGTPLNESYRRHVVEAGVPLIAGDAREHPLLHDNPAIRSNAIAYAGVPVIVRPAIAALCSAPPESKP